MSNIIYYADENVNVDESGILEQAATSAGNSVETFDNGDDLVVAVGNSPPIPKMVFVDLSDTDDGLKVVDEIRHSKHSKIPIVIVSEGNNYKIIQKFKELGANLYIHKCKSRLKFKTAIEFALSTNWLRAETNSKNFYFNRWL